MASRPGYKVKPVLRLTEEDGNAFVLIGKARRVARAAGWPEEEVEAMMNEATSGDYDHLLATLMEWFDVE